MKQHCYRIGVLTLGTLMTAGALAQAFPTRPIRLIVPFPPGGPTDTFSRATAAEVAKSLGQQVIVENRPGAGTTIGADLVAKATPDGHTLFFTDLSTHTITTSLYTRLPYHPLRDFAPVALGVAAERRSPYLPDIPTIAETIRGVEGSVIAGVLAPAGTPRGVIERLNAEFARALAAPKVKEIFAANAAEPLTMTPAELQASLERDVKAWAEVVEATGVKLQ